MQRTLHALLFCAGFVTWRKRLGFIAIDPQSKDMLLVMLIQISLIRMDTYSSVCMCVCAFSVAGVEHDQVVAFLFLPENCCYP